MSRLVVSFLVLTLAAQGLFAAEAAPVSFRNDVMAVLSKAGCNLGTCHGNKSGKGGFKLSLRGDDPRADYDTLTRDQFNRRANPFDPAGSLILLKPTMAIPHQGGRRFTQDDPEYHILRMWIAAGMPFDDESSPRLTSLDVTPREQMLRDPDDHFSIRAIAHFSDGSRKDVTRLSVFEPAEPIVDITPGGDVTRLGFGETTIVVRYLHQKVPVRVTMIPARNDFVWHGPEPANFIDERVFAKLKRLRVNPSKVCDDATFCRRLYLDLLGIPPTADEARRFVDDSRPAKRNRLIDALLDRQEFADHWALKWSDLLRNEEKVLDRKGVRDFHAWLRAAFAENKPFDEMVRQLISARGSTYLNPPANYYRAMREPEMRAESTAQVFLGVRLKCAKCHNHPFDRWTQDDYYGWTNFFSQVDYKVLSNDRRDNNDKHQFDGEQLVLFSGTENVKHPGTGKVPPPRFLGEGEPDVRDREQRLDVLANWITSPANRRFAESQANRLWAQMMGVGIVDPVDDFRATNPPSHPELLKQLGDEFISSGFDVRHLLRTIAGSRTYQLSSRPTAENAGEARNFPFANVHRLDAEQLLDALAVVLGTEVDFNGYPEGIRAEQIAGVSAVNPRYRKPSMADSFLMVFGKPPRLESCECERSDETTLKQAFQLMSGPFLNDLLQRDGNLLTKLSERKPSPNEAVDALYWSILNRPPSPEERERFTSWLGQRKLNRQALEDVAWALLTSTEFLLRH